MSVAYAAASPVKRSQGYSSHSGHAVMSFPLRAFADFAARITAPRAAAAADSPGVGELRKVSPELGEIAIAHAPIVEAFLVHGVPQRGGLLWDARAVGAEAAVETTVRDEFLGVHRPAPFGRRRLKRRFAISARAGREPAKPE